MATVQTDQDLLFGMMALQNSLVEQPDLIAAFQCWLKERSRSMARILVERRALTQLLFCGRPDRQLRAQIEELGNRASTALYDAVWELAWKDPTGRGRPTRPLRSGNGVVDR